jgi:hypothetical protein
MITSTCQEDAVSFTTLSADYPQGMSIDWRELTATVS